MIEPSYANNCPPHLYFMWIEKLNSRGVFCERWISYLSWMILACVENISSCTKYKTVSSPKVSAIITHLSQLTEEACGMSENGLWSRAAGSGSGPAATVWLWVDAFHLILLIYETEWYQYPPNKAVRRTRCVNPHDPLRTLPVTLWAVDAC